MILFVVLLYALLSILILFQIMFRNSPDIRLALFVWSFAPFVLFNMMWFVCLIVIWPNLFYYFVFQNIFASRWLFWDDECFGFCDRYLHVERFRFCGYSNRFILRHNYRVVGITIWLHPLWVNILLLHCWQGLLLFPTWSSWTVVGLRGLLVAFL